MFIVVNFKVYEVSDVVRDVVINGEIVVGNMIDFYGYMVMKQNLNCVYVILVGESIINGDLIVLFKYSKYLEVVQVFIYWVFIEG